MLRETGEQDCCRNVADDLGKKSTQNEFLTGNKGAQKVSDQRDPLYVPDKEEETNKDEKKEKK